MKRIVFADLKNKLHLPAAGTGMLFSLATIGKISGKMPEAQAHLFAFSGVAITITMILIFSSYARHTPARINIYLLPLKLSELAWARMLTPFIYIFYLAVADVIAIALLDFRMISFDFLIRMVSLVLLVFSLIAFLFFLVDFNSSNRNKYLKWISDFFASLVIFLYCAEAGFLLIEPQPRVLFDFSYTNLSKMIFGDLGPLPHLAITSTFLIIVFVSADIWAFKRRISYRDN